MENHSDSIEKWTALPFGSDSDNFAGKYLYLTGGFHSNDSGCPPWGTNDQSNIRFIGDEMGNLEIKYADGTSDRVPLIIGITLWLHSIWMEDPAPFSKEGADEKLIDHLRSSLCVYGAWEKEKSGILRIKIPNKPVRSVSVVKAPDKQGTPVFEKCLITDAEIVSSAGDNGAEFFGTHTVTAGQPFPENFKRGVDAVCFALHNFDSDYENAPKDFDIPEGVLPYKIRFTGGKFAGIATGNVFCNMKNLCDRTDDDGFIHTSYKDAPSWRYDGFGPYVLKANSYYDKIYSRDDSRAIMTLNGYGHKDKAYNACVYADGWMMAYPNDGVTIGGQPIPGHFSVMPNQPYIYSKILSKIAVPALCDDEEGSTASAWPTRYTKERFKDEYENIGNQETDGHGLMMMANYVTWCNRGRSLSELEENWTYIAEGAKWICWCFDHPDLSFVENDLLYGETEAAMNTYTLYANIPCYLGLVGYADMAKAAGKTNLADLWLSYAERLRGGIEKGFSDGEKWNAEKFGFFHDPVLTMMSDIYGYDISLMPKDWVARSAKTYKDDLGKTVAHGWYGANGIGYNHSMITQNALLLDMIEDSDKLLNSLCKLSWFPRLPDPYIVPEGLCADEKRGILRRQGDLGNLVQLAEAMKCWLIAVGVSPVHDGKLRIMPRLPLGWGVSVSDFPVRNTGMTVNMTVEPPKDNAQNIDLELGNKSPDVSLSVRFGPFPKDCKEAKVRLNGREYLCPTVSSGDRNWAWLCVLDQSATKTGTSGNFPKDHT